MITALVITVVLGIVCVSLSLKIDSLNKDVHQVKKLEEDRMYKLSIVKEVEEKLSYETDPEKIIDAVMSSLRTIAKYSTASAAMIKNGHVILKIHVDEAIGLKHIKRVEEDTLAAFEKFVGKLPDKVDRKIYGKSVSDDIVSHYSSSCHLPLIANGEVLALIHLSSATQDAYSNIQELREFIDMVSSLLTRFRQAVGEETEKFASSIVDIPVGILLLASNQSDPLVINDAARELLGIDKNADFRKFLDDVKENFDFEEKVKKVILSKNAYTAQNPALIANRALRISIHPIGENEASVAIVDETCCMNKMLLKEDLINVMVHELRSPATTIKDSSELIITSKDTLGEDKKAKFLEIVHQQAKKILGQVGSILDTAKLDAGKLVLQKVKGDISKLIQEEVQSFAPQAERRKIELTFEALVDSIPEISFDKIRIGQVIDNLLSNSMKFTPENGKIKVIIDYRTLPPTTDGISPMKDILSLDKFVVVSVSDTGAGITPEQQRTLFSKYIQAKNTSEKISAKGTGLGLYLTKGIIEAHHGRIWVKSEVGKGTAFSFSLPTVDGSKKEEDAAKPVEVPFSKYSQTVN